MRRQENESLEEKLKSLRSTLAVFGRVYEKRSSSFEKFYDTFVPGSVMERTKELIEESQRQKSMKSEIYSIVIFSELIRLGTYGLIYLAGNKTHNYISELLLR